MYYELMDPCDHDIVKWQHRGVRNPEIEHVGPLASLGLNGAGDDPDDFMSTGIRFVSLYILPDLSHIAKNKTIYARGESDEPEVAKVAIVKKKSVSRKKSASIADKDADDVHVEVVAEKAVSKKRPTAISEATVVKKKRTTSGKAVSK
ncbi:hypothetical protein F511_04977 [Dorcoceras hygrometricum]|uniref:Uncharacterized protein n=1 Tax=Dorcoceras hygrometricum TaxID=472368 RepID=A0A2Z7BWE1_9LAMI|nr:hypothetical protein F511_04977 [Dorcoceras hygrometricum]